MDNNFLVDNPNKPRKPRISPKQRASINRGLEKAVAIGLFFVPGMVTVAAINIVLPGAVLDLFEVFVAAIGGGTIGGILCESILDTSRSQWDNGDMGIFGFATNAITVAGCIFLPGIFFPHVAENVTMLANTAGNVTPTLNNSALNATALANATANVAPALNNSAANAACALENMTAVLSDNVSCNCGLIVQQESTAKLACTCLGFDPQTGQNVTVPVHSFLSSSLNATTALGAIAGPVREVRARVSSFIRRYET